MNTAMAVDSGYKTLPLSMLDESSSNPRRTFEPTKAEEHQLSTLIEATAALYTYLTANDNDGYAKDQARMLARDVAFDGYTSTDRKAEVVLSRIADTFDTCREYGFTVSSTFTSLWDAVVLAAAAEGYNVAMI